MHSAWAYVAQDTALPLTFTGPAAHVPEAPSRAPGHIKCLPHAIAQVVQEPDCHILPCRLSDLLDQGMAQSVRLLSDEMDLETGPFGRPGEAPGAAPGLLELLGTADR